MKILKTSLRVIYLFGVDLLGWLLIIIGIAGLILPGPGILLMFAGIVVLSTRYTWAGHLRHKTQGWVEETTRASVQTIPRITFSVVMGLLVIIFGSLLIVDPDLPSFINFSLDLKILTLDVGPKIPGAGLGAGIAVIGSGLIALSLVVFGVIKFRKEHKQ